MNPPAHPSEACARCTWRQHPSECWQHYHFGERCHGYHTKPCHWCKANPCHCVLDWLAWMRGEKETV